MTELIFDATNVEPTSTFDPVPPGRYPMMFIESEMKATKAGTGSYVQLVAEILDGSFKGRRIWVRLNVNNPNPQAVEIAQKELSSICRAVGHMKVTNSEELHNKPFIGEVKIDKGTGGYDDSNSIKRYESIIDTSNNDLAAQMGKGQEPAPAKPVTMDVQGEDWWNKK